MLPPRCSSATEAVTECVGYHLYVSAVYRRDSPSRILGETPVTNLKVKAICSLAVLQLYLHPSPLLALEIEYFRVMDQTLCFFLLFSRPDLLRRMIN